MVNMLMYIGALLLSAQVAQPQTLLEIMDDYSINKVVRTQICEAQPETEGYVILETLDYSDGRRISRLSDNTNSETTFEALMRVPGHYLSLTGFDLGADGTFEAAYAVVNNVVSPVFYPKLDADFNALRHSLRKDYESNKARTQRHLNRLREIALKSCK